MGWSERQVAMLAEMGLRVPVVAHESDVPAQEPPGDVAVIAPPAEQPAPAARIVSPPARGGADAQARAEPALARAPVALGQRATGVETMDWAALRQAVVDCSACKLCRGRRQTVFGVGHEQSHWMVVGEAPGEQEDIQGEPFVGKSGQLLDAMLRTLGLSRRLPEGGEIDPSRQVYIANTLKCRPPGNRNPEPDELAQCEPFLIRQIELVKPRIILAMGRFAVQSLLRSQEPIGRLRGRVHRYQGVPLIVTYHPAYLLRNLEDKARAWDDLCLAAQTAETA